MAGKGNAKRDNAYYRDLLRRNHPSVHRDFEAGKYKNLAEALRIAKVKKSRTPLQELLHAWKKASPAERDAFALKVGLAFPRTPTAVPSPATLPFAVDGRLQLASVKLIQDAIANRNMKMGDLMHELGRKRLDTSVGMAISRGTSLQPDLIRDLEVWLAKQGGPSPAK